MIRSFIAAGGVRKLAGMVGMGLFVLLCLYTGLYLRWYIVPQFVQLVEPTANKPAAVYIDFADPDDYTRLDRVRRIIDGEQGPFIRSHPWENWPYGTHPSTTAPMDWCILALYQLCTPYFGEPLDWAGVFVSPLMYVALLLYLTWWSRSVFSILPRMFLLLAVSVLTGTTWATAFAHPDHQSLLLLLLAVALTTEWKRWGDPEKGTEISLPWSIFAGSVWGLALWVSFFEPLILLGVVLAVNLVLRRREQLPFLGAIGVWMLLFTCTEGFHVFTPELLEYRDKLYNWGLTIAELQSLTFSAYYNYLTPVALLLPLLLLRFLLKGGNEANDPLEWRHWGRGLAKIDIFVFIITVVLIGLTIYQQRWLPYGTMAMILFFSMWLSKEQSIWWKIVFALFFVYGTAQAVDHSWRNTGEPQVVEVKRLARAIASRSAASNDKSDVRGLMAPWWTSPCFLYHTRLPIVASSSHASISGIMDSAAFYTAMNWEEADDILVKRKVRWIVVYNPEFILPELNKLVYGPKRSNWPRPVSAIVANELFKVRGARPTRYVLRAFQGDHLRLYEYVPPKPAATQPEAQPMPAFPPSSGSSTNAPELQNADLPPMTPLPPPDPAPLLPDLPPIPETPGSTNKTRPKR
ncbi:MAG: hypothetical protein ACAI35_07730 [Candidatus Methylacidiphilales bacterium]|nr:hypothetical protein [Candidatus Methylacidiphilales bacterium]